MDEFDVMAKIGKLVIEHGPITARPDDDPSRFLTLWGHFEPSSTEEERELKWAQVLCWHLTDLKGQNVFALLARVSHYDGVSKLLRQLSRLEELGVIKIEPGRMILLRKRLSPLERLAACAD